MVKTPTFEDQRLRAYFSHVATSLGALKDVRLLSVAHMVHNSSIFLPALSDIAPVALLLPKPKTADSDIGREIRSQFPGLPIPFDREWAKDANKVAEAVSQYTAPKDRVILVDIGGYFAESLDEIVALTNDRVIGVMEGTENGVQRYESECERRGLGQYSVPIVTVARSPLKLPEDYHVGSGVVFSVEAVLREQAQILQTRSACVIGYGRVGSSVAEVLRGRGIPTVVHDTSPIAMAEAAARGFRVYRRLDDALGASTLVISATGGHAIDRRALASMRSGTVIATVTSIDDEFVESDLNMYKPSYVSPSIKRYDSSGQRYFWLINDGNPANFLHGAVIGPAMQLIEGEKMAAIRAIATGEYVGLGRGISEVKKEHRLKVAEIWNEHFLDD